MDSWGREVGKERRAVAVAYVAEELTRVLLHTVPTCCPERLEVVESERTRRSF